MAIPSKLHRPAAYLRPASIVSGLLSGDRDALGAEIYTEMVGYLFATRWPLAIVSLGFVALSVITYLQTGDSYLAAVGVLGSIIALGHFGFSLLYHRLPGCARRQAAVAARWERGYAIGCYLFSSCLGVFDARLFLRPSDGAGLLGLALLYAYGSGIVARVCMRPRIAVATLILATLPAIAGMIVGGGFAGFSLAAFTAVFLAGSLETVSHIYKSIVVALSLKQGLAALARHDELTGLPNRMETRDRLSDEIARVERDGGLLAVHYLDLDRFKLANDRHGHLAGDTVLRQVGERLLELVRAGDIVGRLGGDEFMVVQTAIAHRDEAELLAMRIIRSIAQPFDFNGRQILIGTSIGIALAPTDGLDMTLLIKYADTALYQAKATSRSCYFFYKAEVERPAVQADEDGGAARPSAGPISA